MGDVSEREFSHTGAMLFFAIAFITAALVFYTMGVWAEHKKKVLTWSHVALFGLGLV